MALAAGSAALAPLAPLPALAAAPKSGVTPGFFRLALGDFEVTALLDGDLDLPTKMFPAAKPDEAAAVLSAANHTNPPRAHVNCYAVNTGDKLYLVDSGTGALFGPRLGKVARNLAAAGMQPEQVDTILVTHLHPDHVGGLAHDGKALYPKAELIYTEADGGFWLSAEVQAKAPKDFQPFFTMAQNAVAPYASRTRKIGTSGPVAPGFEAVALPGHTVGHIGYMVGTGNTRLFIWADVVHNAALQFARPDWGIAFDTDMAAAQATRKRVFDMAATDHLLIAGMHLPFPGIGHVGREGGRYSFQPAFWSS
jgi:glyoxylase-like metal-dependent hydrolase (beta-lactamase superfamily II)